MALKVSGGSGRDGKAQPTSGPITAKNRYDVHPDSPLAALDSPPAVAFKATHRRDSGRQLCAYICDPKAPPRLQIISSLHRIDHPSLLRVVDWDVIDWPPEDRRCPVVISERPPGPRVFDSLQATRQPMTEEAVMRLFIKPVAEVLTEMHELGLYHRKIRPDNLFFTDEDETEIVLGECYTTPPGQVQPAVFETMACGLANPAGRGEGGAENDLYALGVTALSLLFGHVPLAELDDDSVMRQRLTLGSYAAAVRGQRVSLSMMEALRGLMNDDPQERWTMESLELWLNGRRLSPKQQMMPTKATRAFPFAGGDYHMARELAFAMHRNWDAAAEPIRDGSLDTWLRRGLSDEHRIEAVNEAKAGMGEGGANETDRLIARVIIALDPDGPIRLRDFSATIEGVGPLIAAHLHESGTRQSFANVIDMGLGQFWLEQQRKIDPHQIRYLTRLDKSKAMLNQQGLGFGIERVAYELNSGLPCLSPMFERDYVPAVEFVLPALERMLANAEGDEERSGRLIDNHLAAFVATNAKRVGGNELRDLDRDMVTPDARLAQIRVLAALQESANRNTEFKTLSAEAARILEPAIERFQSRERQRRIRDKLRRAGDTGRLQAVLDIVDDNRELRDDQTQFDRAKADYAQSVRETIVVKRDMKNRKALAEEVGGQMSSVLSALGATVTAIVTFVVWWF